MSSEQCGQVTGAAPAGDGADSSLAEEAAGPGTLVKGLMLRFTLALFEDHSCIAHPIMQRSLLVVHTQHD